MKCLAVVGNLWDSLCVSLDRGSRACAAKAITGATIRRIIGAAEGRFLVDADAGTLEAFARVKESDGGWHEERGGKWKLTAAVSDRWAAASSSCIAWSSGVTSSDELCLADAPIIEMTVYGSDGTAGYFKYGEGQAYRPSLELDEAVLETAVEADDLWGNDGGL